MRTPISTTLAMSSPAGQVPPDLRQLTPRELKTRARALGADEAGEMAAARRDALRRLATEAIFDADAGGARRRPRRARRIKKRFTLRAAERDALRSRLRPGKNVVAFSFASSIWGKQTVKAHLYLWSWQAKIVISDVDGTITKSDVIGHLAPMVGKDWNHAGIASLYNRIRDNGFELMFLSSRAVSQSAGTRRYLEKLTQDGETLTHGPVLLAPDSISAALYRDCLLYTSPSPRDATLSRMPSSA